MLYPKLYRIDNKLKQTQNEYLFRFNTPMEYTPGQFVQVSVFGYGEAPISICSYSKDYFELSVRAVGNVTQALASLNEGDMVGIRGPYGNGYDMKLFEGNNLVIIGGGCGVAPLRSIVEYVDKQKEKYGEMRILFGFRNNDEILFAHDEEDWKRKHIYDMVIGQPNPEWKGKKGLITEIIDQHVTTNEKTVAFICGPPGMINAAVKELKKFDFHDDQIFVSAERHMKCATGMCGHCMIHGKYCCKDGPVFRWDEIKDVKE
ncbi:FAD/NAD(P)-binding protein [Candidatus Woesearchaeota archaeon]|nr:FAD/NAD(P)-binding protein [Candidatus Woesearchaeota archaeon]